MLSRYNYNYEDETTPRRLLPAEPRERLGAVVPNARHVRRRRARALDDLIDLASVARQGVRLEERHDVVRCRLGAEAAAGTDDRGVHDRASGFADLGLVRVELFCEVRPRRVATCVKSSFDAPRHRRDVVLII